MPQREKERENPMNAEVKTSYRACHLCEAICGLEIKTQGEQVLSIKGDKNDPLSRGHICAKAAALQDFHLDPDRLKHPVKRVGDKWERISWDEAYKTVAENLVAVQEKNGLNAVRKIGLFGLSFEEHITNWLPNKSYNYQLQSKVLLRNHQGVMHLSPCNSGIKLSWSIRFDAPIPGLGAINSFVITRLINGSLKKLKRLIERK